MTYSMKKLDGAIEEIIGADVNQAMKDGHVPMPSRLRLAVENAFVYPDKFSTEATDIVRMATLDLLVDGKFNYAKED